MQIQESRSIGLWVRIHARKLMIVAGMLCLATAASAVMVIPNLFPFLDPTGIVSTYNTAGPIVESTPFFQSLGTNGRSCATCHIAGNGMGLSTQNIQQRFVMTGGTIHCLRRLMAPTVRTRVRIIQRLIVCC